MKIGDRVTVTPPAAPVMHEADGMTTCDTVGYIAGITWRDGEAILITVQHDRYEHQRDYTRAEIISVGPSAALTALNRRRAAAAARRLYRFSETPNAAGGSELCQYLDKVTDEDAVDLLANLLHLARERGWNWDEIESTAVMSYHHEISGEVEAERIAREVLEGETI